MLTSKFLKGILTEAYPVIKRQVEDAKTVSGFRDIVAANGGDWSALKALIKAHVEDQLDETGEGKRVRKILDKADTSNAYAGMLGLNMNEENFSAEQQPIDREDRRRQRFSESMDDHKALIDEIGADGLMSPEAVAENKALADALAAKFGNGPLPPHDIETGEITEDKIEPSGISGEFNSAPIGTPPGSMADSDGGVDATTVAPIQPETATSFVRDKTTPDIGSARVASAMLHPGVVDGPTTVALQAGTVVTAGETAPNHAAGPGEGTASSPAPLYELYAARGVVVMEKCPPRGIVAHPYAACWPVNNIVVPGGVRNPIVKIEHFILDGRGRYFAAREAGIEYPVVQYDGTDPLLDCIRWNLASRTIAGEPKRIVAHKLCKLEPDRADEIMSAMGLAEERAAAE